MLKRIILVLGLLGILILAGCAPKPVILDMQKLSVKAHRDLLNDIALNEPIIEEISLYEAMARALKYNLDAQIEIKDEEFRRRQNLVINSGMWPSLLATFGINSRDNLAASSSRSVITGTQSLEPSTSSERTYATADLTASWDLLDFGVAYAESQQGVTEESIARERRRKVVNRIIENVRTAYWRAVSAERTFSKLLALESLAQQALVQTRALEEGRKTPIKFALEYQRDLLKIQRNVQQLQRELVLAKHQLATLINLAPNTKFSLEIPSRTDIVPVLPGSARQMIRYALYYRPELREVFYEQQIEGYKEDIALYESLPGFKLLFGANYNSNDFLSNRQWASLSTSVSWNLMSLFRYPLQRDALKAESEVILARRQAITMAIITQVYVARARFVRLSQELSTIRKSHNIQVKILALTEAGHKANQISQRELVMEKMNEILDEISYDTAYADLQNAYAGLYSSMGIANFDVEIGDEEDLEELTTKLRDRWTQHGLALPKLGG
ncbi:TolC family protein [Marinomonas sp.]